MNRLRHTKENEILEKVGLAFHRDRSGFWRMKAPTVNNPTDQPTVTNKVKRWVVDRLAAGYFQGNRGPKYWVAVSIRLLWGRGFDRA